MIEENSATAEELDAQVQEIEEVLATVIGGTRDDRDGGSVSPARPNVSTFEQPREDDRRIA